MHHVDPSTKTMIICPQKPDEGSHRKAPAGKTSVMLQKLTGAGFFSMHRNKEIVNEEERAMFHEHLVSGGWLIITGHGVDSRVAGAYKLDDGSVLDIEFTPADYVNLILQSHALKDGDHINIILSICNGAKTFEDVSFAGQLASDLAVCGISSDIYASMSAVGRITDYNPSIGDKLNKRLRFRLESQKDLRKISTLAHDPHSSIVSKPDVTIYFDKGGVQVNAVPEVSDLMHATEDYVKKQFGIDLGDDPDFAENFLLSTEEAMELVEIDNTKVIFHTSGSYPDMVVATFYNAEKNSINHLRFSCVKDHGVYVLDNNGLNQRHLQLKLADLYPLDSDQSFSEETRKAGAKNARKEMWQESGGKPELSSSHNQSNLKKSK